MIRTYDYLEKNGRLGNQLFQIAATIGMAEAEADGSSALLKSDWEYRPYFSVPDHYFSLPLHMQDQRIVDGGTEYFQELHYFNEIEDVVRAYFAPSELSRDFLYTTPQYDPITKGMADVPACSIHVRRGDYVKYPHHFPLPTPEYYQRAIEMVLEEEPSTEFFVFSDDIDWCKAHFGVKRMQFIRGIPRPVEIADRKVQGEPLDQFDLFAMAMCDRHIIANSTFSWWGAWLSDDNRVIYPSRWFGEHPAVKRIPWRKMIPDTWVEVAV